MPLAEQIACEDIVMFVNAAVTATAQREFHSDAAAQRLSLEFLHEYVLGNYRDLYAATLALDINQLNAAMIVTNLLRSARDASAGQRAVEGRLIAARLRRLAPQRVYGVFRQLRRLGVNNRRTRAIVREWIQSRPDQAFDAVKYRRSLAVAARHAHLSLPGEVGTALFDWRRPTRYHTPILESWRRAHYEQRALYELPYTVAQGLATRHGIDRARFLSNIAPRLTGGERLRLQSTAARHRVDAIAMDLATVPLTRLARYVVALPRPQRAARREELSAALRAAARRAAGLRAGTWGRVAAVLDDSYSATGSATKRYLPLAIALATHHLLEALATEYTGLWLTHRGDPLLVHPIGATGLGARLLDGLALRPDRLVIVSDGWDNAPPGQAAEVLRVWALRLDPGRATSIVHLNPVYDADCFDVRRLAAGVATVGVRDAEDVAALVELARFATGGSGLDELRRHLADQVDRFLGAPEPAPGAVDPADPAEPPATIDPARPAEPPRTADPTHPAEPPATADAAGPEVRTGAGPAREAS